MNDKKGQVTLFIILGLVVLIIVGVAVFLIKIHTSDEPDNSIYEEDYDARLAPIYNDVVFCMNSLGKEAITQIGATGGYTNIDTNKYTYNSLFAYNNNALELFPESGMIIPYWEYISDDPDCTDCEVSQSYPSLTGEDGDSIQNSIETYVENNLVTCLDNFSAYKFDLSVDYAEAPVCSVEIRDENVYVGLDWQINVLFSDGTNSSSLKRYSTTLDVQLKKMYEYALSILYQTEMVEDTRAFEYFTKDIISFYSFGGQDAEIPPVSGPTIFEFVAPKIWLQKNVENILKNTVSETIPYMQVSGTKDSFIMQTNNSIKSNFYSNFQNVVYYDDAFAENVRVRFNYYPIWPFYVSVGPSDGPVIMPESVVTDLWLVKLSTIKYKFYYDVTYPVLVTLEDDSAFEGEGFTFNYAFEVNLKDNDPYSNETIDMDDYLAEEDEETVEDLGYSQRTVPVKINVVNGYTNLPEEGVAVSYTCLDKEYLVGTSEKDKNTHNTFIDSYLAPCLGGTFTVASTGYAESPINMDVSLDEPILMDYIVYPAKDIQLELKRKLFKGSSVNPTNDEPVVNREWTLSSGEASTSSLEKDEEFMFIMSEIKSDGSTGSVAVLNSNDESRTISLIPGKYSIEVIATVNLGAEYSRMNITIPAREIKMKGETTKIEQVVINTTMYVGGITIDDSTTGYLTITPQDLLTKSSLIVYYPSFSLSDGNDIIDSAGYINTSSLKYIEDLNVLTFIYNATEDYPDYFIPVME